MRARQEADDGNVIRTASLAQRRIGQRISAKSIDVKPCNGCEHATENGCDKESFKPAGGKPPEIGPLFDPAERAVVCPIQRGLIFITSNNGNAPK